MWSIYREIRLLLTMHDNEILCVKGRHTCTSKSVYVHNKHNMPTYHYTWACNPNLIVISTL